MFFLWVAVAVVYTNLHFQFGLPVLQIGFLNFAVAGVVVSLFVVLTWYLETSYSSPCDRQHRNALHVLYSGYVVAIGCDVGAVVFCVLVLFCADGVFCLFGPRVSIPVWYHVR